MELNRLIDSAGGIAVEAPGVAGVPVSRLLRVHSRLAAEPVGEGTLLIADAAAQRQLVSVPETRITLGGLREAGIVGVVFLGPLEVAPESVTVFRQLKLFLGVVPGPEGSDDRVAAQLQSRLQSVLDREAEHDRRQLEIVQQLLAAMNAEDPIAAVVGELGRQCRGSALLYDSAGTVVESTGAAPQHLLQAELRSRDLTQGAFTVGRWNAAGRELSIRAQSYVLVLASRSPELLAEYGQFLLDSVTQLLGSFQALDSFAVAQQIQSSSQLLREIDLGIPPGKERQYWERMRQYGFSPFSSLRYITATTSGYSMSRSELRSITAFAATSGVPALVSENVHSSELEPGFRMLAEASRRLEKWLSQLSGTLAVGVSQPFAQLSVTPEEAQAAQIAEALARRRRFSPHGGASTAVYVDRLDPADWLLARARSTRDRAHLEKYVAPLREHQQLWRTLLEHFDHQLHIPHTAQAMGLHQNTLRYRLTKIEELLQVRLSHPEVIANLYLCLKDEMERHRSDSSLKDSTATTP